MQEDVRQDFWGQKGLREEGRVASQTQREQTCKRKGKSHESRGSTKMNRHGLI